MASGEIELIYNSLGGCKRQTQEINKHGFIVLYTLNS